MSNAIWDINNSFLTYINSSSRPIFSASKVSRNHD